MKDRGILAHAKPSGENVYRLISDLDGQSALNQRMDAEPIRQINSKLQAEAESFFSSISPDATQHLVGVAVRDWFDRDELDRDLRPLIEQQVVELETGLKIAKAKSAPNSALRSWRSSHVF